MVDRIDVIVIGGGLAGLCAALAAREEGRSVTILERAPIDERGGNARFSNGAMRAVYGGVEDIEALVGDLSDDERKRADFGEYSHAQYFDDLARVTEYRSEMRLAELLVENSRDTMLWLRKQGLGFLPLYEWQTRLPDGRIKFSGGSAVEVNGAGEGIVTGLYKAAERAGVKIIYGTRVTGLIDAEAGVAGVVARQGRKAVAFDGKAVVLACGGFEANAEWRTRYLGPSWELAKVRGSRFNTGDGIRMALDIGAAPAGNWSGCHSSSWDFNAPDTNEVANGAIFKRDDYLYGIVVNAKGRRFFDEGADVRALTYAKLGRAILAQPGQIAWQLFDKQGAARLHGEYRIRQAARFRADTLEALVGQLDGLEGDACLATIAEFNAAVSQETPLDYAKKDGRSAVGLDVPRSNWAQAIVEPPFEAYAVTCGITFTFGGIRINAEAQVIDDDGHIIPNLFAAGELVGGLFYFNYPGGAGLMAAAVFGRLAGTAAGRARA
jgi:tricarballylate dehydrogenase